MKTLIIALLFASTTMGQTEKSSVFLTADEKDEKVMLFHTDVRNGLDRDVPIQLKIRKDDLILMESTKVYNYWSEQERGNLDLSMENFLEWLVMNASLETKYGLVRTNSYEPLGKDEAQGTIFIDKDQGAGVLLKLKAQNGYGNSIFGESMVVREIKKGKVDVFKYINFN